MEKDFFSQMQKLTSRFSGKLNILEEQIDINVQMAYFKAAKKIKNSDKTFSIEDLPSLDDESLSLTEKKHCLVKLASIDDPRAYRIIEAYAKKSEGYLKDWSILALQDNKMLMEMSLLNENQVFISTGLGGKGDKLRYFIVLIGKDDEFKDFQKKIVSSEFELTLKNNDAELEEMKFVGKYVLITTLIPFSLAFDTMFKNILVECNQYGNFLNPNFLITNVKKLNIQEIESFVSRKSKKRENLFENPENQGFTPEK